MNVTNTSAVELETTLSRKVAKVNEVVNDVPLKRNRVTKMRGSLYNTNATTEFVLDQDWITEVEVPF